MPLSLQNKKIIISAGASGIGWATAKVCLSKGAIVYICDINNKSLNKIKKNSFYNKKLFAYECDASDEEEVSNWLSIKYDWVLNGLNIKQSGTYVNDSCGCCWKKIIYNQENTKKPSVIGSNKTIHEKIIRRVKSLEL